MKKSKNSKIIQQFLKRAQLLLQFVVKNSMALKASLPKHSLLLSI